VLLVQRDYEALQVASDLHTNREMATERDPLLVNESGGVGHSKHRHPGPLEISTSARYGILAGLWSANFLSVSFPYHSPSEFSDVSLVFEQYVSFLIDAVNATKTFMSSATLVATCTNLPSYAYLWIHGLTA
jgi:hypothetical protein